MEKEEEEEEGEEEIVVGPKTYIFEEYQYQILRQRISADKIYQNLS